MNTLVAIGFEIPCPSFPKRPSKPIFLINSPPNPVVYYELINSRFRYSLPGSDRWPNGRRLFLLWLILLGKLRKIVHRRHGKEKPWHTFSGLLICMNAYFPNSLSDIAPSRMNSIISFGQSAESELYCSAESLKNPQLSIFVVGVHL